MKIEHCNKAYQCNECPEKFERLNKLKRHKFTVHNDSLHQIQCPYCITDFSEDKNLIQHILSVHMKQSVHVRQTDSASAKPKWLGWEICRSKAYWDRLCCDYLGWDIFYELYFHFHLWTLVSSLRNDKKCDVVFWQLNFFSVFPNIFDCQILKSQHSWRCCFKTVVSSLTMKLIMSDFILYVLYFIQVLSCICGKFYEFNIMFSCVQLFCFLSWNPVGHSNMGVFTVLSIFFMFVKSRG